MFKQSLAAVAASVALCTGGAAHASYPSSPVTIVVPFAAGQTGDIIARLVSKELASRLGQAFIVENKPGGGGRIGTAFVAKAKADGHTLLLTSTGPYAIAPALYPKTTHYDPVRDFTAVAELASTPQIIAVSNDLGVTSLAGLVQAAKAGELFYGSAGLGSTQHLTMELLKQKLDFPMTHAPFKGSAESKLKVMSGMLAATSDSLPAIYGNIKAGQLKALAVVDDQRSAYLPEVPTLAEAGFQNLSTVAFFGLVAPQGTPREVVDTLNRQLLQAVRTPEFVEKMQAQALTAPQARTPEQFNAYLHDQVARWKGIVEDAHVAVEGY